MKKYDEMMNELSDKFNGCPELPESLSKESIIKKIKENNIKPEEKKTFSFKMEALAAAVAVIIVAAVVMAQGGNNLIDFQGTTHVTENQPEVAFNPENAVSVDVEGNSLPEGVYTFKDSESAKKHVLTAYKSDNYYYYFTDSKNQAAATTFAAVSQAVTAAPMAPGDTAHNTVGDGAVGSSSHTETNQQTVGVDEGDIIKNDGRYIYVAGNQFGYESRVKIIDTETMSLVYSSKNVTPDGIDSAVDEMYVDGNRLTVVYDYTQYDEKTKLVHCTTYVDVYDITDKVNPRKIMTKTQDGRFTSSRMIGDVLYTVSVYTVTGKDKEEAEKYALPLINGEEISGSCIFYFEEPSLLYSVITAIDTSDENAESTSIAILGGSEEIYCSENAVYCVWSGNRKASEGGRSITRITSFSIDGTAVKCKASGEVTGRYNNQYSFDEYKGYLRVATTHYDYKTYKNVSSIYVLDESLKVVGSCENLADDEQVKSVRFMGDRGYVVTFRQTDPLFSLDLSDPEKPVVTGELKLPGYSTYLHPLSENTLMGIGYGGDESNADMGKLKIALFDISDMTEPRLLDEYIIDSSSSQANYDPKALIHFAERSIIGIPVFTYNADSVYGVNSFAIITYSENKLSQVTGFVHDTTRHSEFFRGTCTGDKLYTVDSFKVIEHSLQSGEKVRECVITDEKEEINNKGIYATTVPPYIP